MVTRVDKKPIIYNTTFIRALRPAVTSNRRALLRALQSKAVGHAIPDVSASDLLDDYAEMEYGMRMFGVEQTYSELMGFNADDDDDEAIRICRMYTKSNMTTKQVLRNEELMFNIAKVQAEIIKGTEKIYYGTEAVYQLYNRCLSGHVFVKTDNPNYSKWATDTAKAVLLAQATSIFLHPAAVDAISAQFARDTNHILWNAWDLYKKIETIAVRIASRKSFLAHSHYSGVYKRKFEPSKNPEEDFMLPLTGYASTTENVSAYIMLGLKYYKIGSVICVLSHDDCINLATMAQCYFRTAFYFSASNGYHASYMINATSIIRDMVGHCCKLIDSHNNFANFIRALHILAQGEFNDAFEEQYGGDYGWDARGENYLKEAKALDASVELYYKRCVNLAVDEMDRMNTCFMYHALVGDEMLVSDLRSKVAGMSSKVRSADKDEWARFIRFCKTYALCRFMFVYKRKPRVKGEVTKLNDDWAERNVKGHFTVPPQSEWGKVWIHKEFRYQEFADLWHLECQDVAYVFKDSAGTIAGKYAVDKSNHSELLMAMKNGNILDPITGSTSKTARDRIIAGKPPTEVVITTAPKAENAKPSWKKRVTFAADCEFRKMQAEVDKNCRRVMSFIRGPSLGVDQCILEKQFADISSSTFSGLGGVISSHDISAWSESMDRSRKFEFEKVLTDMFDRPEMSNIAEDWKKIVGIVNKQGCRDIVKIENGSFQGFDGSASTLLHSFILIYCIDTARRKGILTTDIKTNMATLIDDCIALMVGLHSEKMGKGFWAHLKETYLKLGFEIDELKSVFSNIKAIYLSRRFCLGGEVPADLKIFLKAHSSYEDPLRNSMDAIQDIFGALRGACDANGEPWFIYYTAVLSSLAEIAHQNNCVMEIPPDAAAMFALCPTSENGWGMPTITSWATNDILDKLAHFNAIIEGNAVHMCQSEAFIAGVPVQNRVAIQAISAIKNQAWRMVSYANIFTSPFEAVREGPLKPDMLKRNAVQDLLKEFATADPWKSLLTWNTSNTTEKVRELLIQSGPLHAPTLSALVNCMPDNFRLSLVGKGVGSQSLFDQLPAGERLLLKRRVQRCAAEYFKYTATIYKAAHTDLTSEDLAAMTYIERTTLERESFYACNGVEMIDHTFPDPVATFTAADISTRAVISPNRSHLMIWDKSKNAATKTSHYISPKGLYVPRKSGRVWEVTCEQAKGWDTVSQRVAMGLAILARAAADGHEIGGLQSYFIKAWNELSNITPQSTHLISIHGSIKRLDANPGSSTHPIICNRNILRSFNNNLKPALDAIPIECSASSGTEAHLHDMLAHETSMLCVTSLMFSAYRMLHVDDTSQHYNIAVRKGCVVPESKLRMRTNLVQDAIDIEIMEGEDNYGLLQACPDLVEEVAVPTMISSWVKMINALLDRNMAEVDKLRAEVHKEPLEVVLEKLKKERAVYSPAVILAAPPSRRHSIVNVDKAKITILETKGSSRAQGDSYTRSIKPISSKFTRELTREQPRHIIAATAIRSLVWSRLQNESMLQLAKILYTDPDMDVTILHRASKQDFWRGAILEVQKVVKDQSLSDATTSAFRSLGVPDLHLLHSNDVKAVTHAVASYFGAHLKSVCKIIADHITQVAGRSEKQFSKPIIERIVTYNPGVTNARLRESHMKKLIATVREGYAERLAKLAQKTETHRGDIRACEVSREHRIDDIWARKNVYDNVGVYNKGRIRYMYGKMTLGLVKEASRRLEFSKEEEHELAVDMKVDDLEKNLHEFTEYDPNERGSAIGLGKDKEFLKSILTVHEKVTASKKKEPYDMDSVVLGSKLALDTLIRDEGLAMKTIFAVSPAQVAPTIYKRVIITQAKEPEINPAVAEEEPSIWSAAEGEIMMNLDFDPWASIGGPSVLPIPAWKGIYTCLMTGHFSADMVNEALDTSIPENITPASLREAHLDEFLDSEIYEKFPGLFGDYMSCGALFDEEWLNRDEADAYTTDEMHTLSIGFLM